MITAVAHTILPAARNLSLEKKGLSQSGSSRANRWLVYKRQVLPHKTVSASLVMLSGNAVWNTVTGKKPLALMAPWFSQRSYLPRHGSPTLAREKKSAGLRFTCRYLTKIF